MNKPQYLFFIAICYFASLHPLLAQKNLNVEQAKQQFPDEDAVFMNQKAHLQIDYQNNNWDISKNVSEDILFLSNTGAMQLAERSIFYSSFEEIKDIDAKTIVPIKKGKKTKYEERKVKNIETKDVLMGNIFYSDQKQKTLMFPGVQAGAKTHLSYTEQVKDPHMLGAFYFSSFVPVLNSEFSVSFPEHVEITYILLGENTDQIKFNKTSKDGWTTYSWIAKNVDKIERENAAPHSSYYTPHLAIYINKADDNGKEVPVIDDVNGLYQWYYSLVKDVNQTPDENLQKVVQDLTNGVSDNKEKIKRIYQWVQQNIKYVAFEDGLGGFIPREAKDVCKKKYGDCKDMSSIITEMLAIADIPAHLTWIGSRDRPYAYRDVPTPIVDNHMIAATKIDGKFMFLDATGEYLPFGLPTSMIQGKEALIGLGKDKYEIVKVPIIPKEDNVKTETITLNIDNGNVTGQAKANLTGYKKVFAEYNKLRAENANAKFFDEFLRKGSNKFAITKVNETGFYDRENPIDIDYEFAISGYAQQAAGKIYLNMNLDKKFQHAIIDTEKRKLSRENEYQYIDDITVNLQVPDGYTVDYLPENSQHKHELFGYEISYEQKGNKIIYNKKLYMNHLLLTKDKFKDWNAMNEELVDAYQEAIVLKKAE